jgi:hypothetical protein
MFGFAFSASGIGDFILFGLACIYIKKKKKAVSCTKSPF